MVHGQLFQLKEGCFLREAGLAGIAGKQACFGPVKRQTVQTIRQIFSAFQLTRQPNPCFFGEQRLPMMLDGLLVMECSRRCRRGG